MAYTPYLNPLTVSLAGMTTSTWTTLASGVPAGASGVKLLWVSGGASAAAFRFVRKNGSTDTFQSQTTEGWFGNPTSNEWNMGVDSSGNFQFFTSSGAPTEGTMYVLGYFGSESVFLTNAVSLGAMPTSYSAISCSSAIPGTGIAGFFFITGGGDNSAYLRMNGSTDDFSNASEPEVCKNYVVGCDGSQHISGIALGSRTLWCQGYMTAGITWHTNAVNVTPASSGSNQNIAQAGGDTGVIANLYYLTSGGTDCAFRLSGQGASTIPVTCYPSSTYTGPYSAYAPSQINMSSVTLGTLYELGYFTATSATPSIAWLT